jgi:hypothetical protein
MWVAGPRSEPPLPVRLPRRARACGGVHRRAVPGLHGSTARRALPVFFKPRQHTPILLPGVESRLQQGGAYAWLKKLAGPWTASGHGSSAGRQQSPELWATEDSGIRTKGPDSITLHVQALIAQGQLREAEAYLVHAVTAGLLAGGPLCNARRSAPRWTPTSSGRRHSGSSRRLPRSRAACHPFIGALRNGTRRTDSAPG